MTKTQSEEASIKLLLKAMNEHWPDGLELWAAAGTLFLVKASTKRILATYPYINCDGGDPDIGPKKPGGSDYIIME